jgi:hypothetical protein
MVIAKMFNTSYYRRLLTLTWAFTTPLYAADWKMNIGVHDFVVAQENSHTFGAGIGFWVAHTTGSSILLTASFDTFLDIDIDELDEDHIPVWFKSKLLAKGLITAFSKNTYVNWLMTFESKTNTVSAVEQQFTLMPGINLEYNSHPFSVGSSFFTGYYFLEIDDDAPKQRGYSRHALQNKSAAISLSAEMRFSLGENLQMTASAQQWHDGDAWLENQYALSLSYNSNSWIKDSKIIISAEHVKYNLDPYDNQPQDAPDYQPILAWDNDTMIRAYLNFPLDW